MGSGVFAQKANFEACVKFSEKNLSDYVHSLSVYPSWIGNSDFFWYYYTTSDGTVYYLVDAGKGKKQKLFSTERLAAVSYTHLDVYKRQGCSFTRKPVLTRQEN